MNQDGSAPRLRVLVISPLYFPTEEGLAHYTTEFCRHLQTRADVSVLTGPKSTVAGLGPGGVTVMPWVERWDLAGCVRAIRRALRSDPDRVLIQFVPFMYSPRGGINVAIVAVAAGLSLRARFTGRGSVQVMFHELWYPYAPEAKALLMHAAHRLMVLGVSLSARQVFCATQRFAAEVERSLGPFRRSVHVLAVGSNLERDDAPRRSRPARNDSVLQAALFGSLHPSKNVPLVLQALHRASLLAPGRLKLCIIGLEREQVLAMVPDLRPWLDAEATITGVLPAAEAAEKLAEQDFLVSYFQDGVSSRRGSLLAALCEGVPVVTTWRDLSDRVFLDQPSVKLLSCDEATFADQLVSFVSGQERPFAGVGAAEVRAFYRANFSWSAVIQRYLELSLASA